jgi:hypothetical protein
MEVRAGGRHHADEARGEDAMNMALAVAIVTMLLPFLAVAALLWVAGRIRERREACIARQISLTEAIHRELGAAAPEVRRSRSREWIVSVRVPLDREETVAAITRITHDVFRRLEREDPPRVRVVLRPQEARPRARAMTIGSTRAAGRLSRAA